MKESTFVNEFESIAKEVLGDKSVVMRKANLYYELFLNRKLELATPKTKAPKRGKSSFQTDICIFELVENIEFPRAESQIRPFAKDLIEKELQISRILEQIHFEGRKVDYYCRDVVFRNFGKNKNGYSS
ncbi:MAG: hypothetical protein K4571_04250 [Deltaproteobacteria bacterium]